jgi:hypothetical protein
MRTSVAGRLVDRYVCVFGAVDVVLVPLYLLEVILSLLGRSQGTSAIKGGWDMYSVDIKVYWICLIICLQDVQVAILVSTYCFVFYVHICLSVCQQGTIYPSSRGSHPARSRRIFQGEKKFLSTPFLSEGK